MSFWDIILSVSVPLGTVTAYVAFKVKHRKTTRRKSRS